MAAFCGLFYYFGHVSDQPRPGKIIPENLADRLLPGDILFRRGSGLWTGVFSQASRRDAFFSHVGIVVRMDGKLLVVHADADDLTGIGGVRQEDPVSFLSGTQGVAIGRFTDPAGKVGMGEKIARQAADPQWKKLPFDTHFSLEDDGQAVYCTEFVWLAIRRATGIDVVNDKTVFAGRQGISVDDLLNSPWLRIVYDRRIEAGKLVIRPLPPG